MAPTQQQASCCGSNDHLPFELNRDPRTGNAELSMPVCTYILMCYFLMCTLLLMSVSKCLGSII